jgi:hypothetical protein
MIRMPGATAHPQRRISCGDRSADVDDGIADLLLEAWRADFDTMMSCQDAFGRIWILFTWPAAAERFLTIVASQFDADLEGIYHRIVGEHEVAGWDALRTERAWTYQVDVVDWGLGVGRDDEQSVRAEGDMPDIHIALSVRFPITDYEEVLERMRRYNEERAP